MILEKDKVYKILHKDECSAPKKWRDYIICSPKVDVDTEKLDLHAMGMKYTQFHCNFVICFDGRIDTGECSSGFLENCEIVPLRGEDIDEIRKAINILGIKYNRKLNKLVL